VVRGRRTAHEYACARDPTYVPMCRIRPEGVLQVPPLETRNHGMGGEPCHRAVKGRASACHNAAFLAQPGEFFGEITKGVDYNGTGTRKIVPCIGKASSEENRRACSHHHHCE
jgi:hypothetical protein